MTRADPDTCFEAARRHYTLKLTCWRCQGVQVVHPAAVWWHFHRRGIPDTFVELARHAKCTDCRRTRREIISGPKVELCREEVTSHLLTMPSEGSGAGNWSDGGGRG